MAKRSTRRRRGRSGRRRPVIRSHLARTAGRVRLGLLVLVGLCLILALRCLELIGPPPRLRIDALWVNHHVYLVRVMLAALAGAAAASLLLIFSRRGRAVAIMLWGLAGVAAIWLYDDRLWVIFRVVLRHSAG